MSVPVGYTELGTVGYTDKGDYNPYATYNRFNTVKYNASTWVARHDGVVGVAPVEGNDWHLMAKGYTLILDDVPTNGSENPVKSDGIYDALKDLQDSKQVKFRYMLENQKVTFVTHEFVITNANITADTHIQVYFKDTSLAMATRSKINIYTDTGRIIFRCNQIPTVGTSSVPLYCDIVYDKEYTVE